MKIQKPLRHPDKFFINGQWTLPSSTSTISVFDSATEERYLSVPEALEDDINKAVSAARNAFDTGPWPRLTHAERADCMRRIADELDKRAEQRAQIWTIESGVIYGISKTRMASLSQEFRGVAKLADTFPFQERHPSKSGGSVALLVREPVGVTAAIVPWNGPSAAITSKVAPALLAGCTVIFKASPEAPGAAYMLAEACESAGVPPGVVNVLTADRAASELLVRHPDVDKVAFTGSTAAGQRIASICGERMARCTLELGGKSPAIVMDDYDLETAAKSIAERATFLTGQVCLSLTRIIVSRKRHDALLEALASCFKAVTVGDPFDPSSQMGPLATRRQLERVQGYIQKGRSEGAELATGGGRPSHLSRGFFIEPTVFGNVDNQCTIAREEIFGPVLAVIPADSDDQAISIANDTDYGLNASVFTNDVEKAYNVARRIRSGTVGQSGTRVELSLSFGGFKKSGLGREGGTEGLRSFLESKVVVLDGMPQSAGPVKAFA